MPLSENVIAMLHEKAKMDRFLIRTVEHIHRVQNNMLRQVTWHSWELEGAGVGNGNARRLMWAVMNHDQSKFSHRQFFPYIEITEHHRQKKILKNDQYEYKQDAKALIDEAIKDHCLQEAHHPERMTIDKYSRRYDALDMLETICDLQAMAQEFNEGSCRKFYIETWCKKHRAKFSHDEWGKLNAIALIAIQCFEKDIAEATGRQCHDSI